jgi:hypothetical protein
MLSTSEQRDAAVLTFLSFSRSQTREENPKR